MRVLRTYRGRAGARRCRGHMWTSPRDRHPGFARDDWIIFMSHGTGRNAASRHGCGARLGRLASAQLPSVARLVGACLLHCTGVSGKNGTHSFSSCVTIDRGATGAGAIRGWPSCSTSTREVSIRMSFASAKLSSVDGARTTSVRVVALVRCRSRL